MYITPIGNFAWQEISRSFISHEGLEGALGLSQKRRQTILHNVHMYLEYNFSNTENKAQTGRKGDNDSNVWAVVMDKHQLPWKLSLLAPLKTQLSLLI